MLISLPRLPAALRRCAAPLALGLTLAATGCYYDGHRNMGATEKWVGSDVNMVPKVVGTPIVAIVDSAISPATMLWDQAAYDPEYSPEHHYLSYAASRTVARSHMGAGYQWLTLAPTLAFDTVWLIVTGPIDLGYVLVAGDEQPMKAEPKGPMAGYVASSSH